MKYKILFLLAALAINFSAEAQQYWVIFTDKPAYTGTAPLVSPQAAENRKQLGLPVIHPSDIPVSSAYVEELKDRGIAVTGTSKWMNAAFVDITANQAASLRNCAFVKEILPARSTSLSTTAKDFDPVDHSQALMQMKVAVFNKAKITGKGVTIGVIDAGYYGADQNKTLAHLFSEKKILGIRDYVNPKKTNHYGDQETGLDFHGTTVLENIAGYNAEMREQLGFAMASSFYLARTDHGKNEFRGEEHYYVRALEWLDSLGVRLVNTSLGYATGFDDKNENYKPSDMNGKTSVISRAVQTAATEKGMLIVVAAGNEGLKPDWRVISAPADAQGVLSVGATEFDSWTRAGYSGRGPEALPYLKPDVSCFSLTGTSFSAPVITGFAACLLEKKPGLKSDELIKIIQQSSHLYPYGNNLVGYGVPQADVALGLLKDPKSGPKAKRIDVAGKTYTYKLKDKKQVARNGGVVLFHKKNETIVTLEEKGELNEKGGIIVQRKEGAARTTLQAGLEVTEIVWK